jgi:hypothetical protein
MQDDESLARVELCVRVLDSELVGRADLVNKLKEEVLWKVPKASQTLCHNSAMVPVRSLSNRGLQVRIGGDVGQRTVSSLPGQLSEVGECMSVVRGWAGSSHEEVRNNGWRGCHGRAGAGCRGVGSGVGAGGSRPCSEA